VRCDDDVAAGSFDGGRRSIIINYVSPDWRDTFELA
jgi:hypothetical protein